VNIFFRKSKSKPLIKFVCYYFKNFLKNIFKRVLRICTRFALLSKHASYFTAVVNYECKIFMTLPPGQSEPGFGAGRVIKNELEEKRLK